MKLLTRPNSLSKKTAFEVLVALLSAAVLAGLAWFESELFQIGQSLSKNGELFSTLIYCALINFNVILILLLSFLIFRNVTKLVVDRRRGVIGSRLRSKLVLSLVFFALAPTILLFYISSRFILSTFETWFSERVKVTIQQTRNAGSHIYKQDQKRLASLARIALQRIKVVRGTEGFDLYSHSLVVDDLKDFSEEYGLSRVLVFDRSGQKLWEETSTKADLLREPSGIDLNKRIRMFSHDRGKRSHSAVVGVDEHDVVRGVVPIRSSSGSALLGLVVTEVAFETQILKSIEAILKDFADLRPSAELIKASYLVLMIVMTLLILFSAIWLGFYVARGVSRPLLKLAEATREVALGNYRVSIETNTTDETGQLIYAFNKMTRDLLIHRQNSEEARKVLQKNNEELDQRRQSMEIILKHVSAGVLSVDTEGRVTSINRAAESLLGLSGGFCVGRSISRVLGDSLLKSFWLPIYEEPAVNGFIQKQVEIEYGGRKTSLMASCTYIYDEAMTHKGSVVVFDDASEQLKAQRVAAWREVTRRIAHEIKNPVTPIRLSAQRLQRRFQGRYNDDEAAIFDSCIATILSQVDVLSELVNEFSKFSRLPKIERKLENLAEIVFNSCELYESSYPKIEFIKSKASEIPDIPIDKEQIGRVIVNLIVNAIAAMKDGEPGKIEVTLGLTESKRYVRVEIKDNGVGVPPAMKEKVFDPYFSTKPEGTGLGLAIVKQIVSDHDGSLLLRENKPVGTIVVIELPVVLADG